MNNAGKNKKIGRGRTQIMKSLKGIQGATPKGIEWKKLYLKFQINHRGI